MGLSFRRVSYAYNGSPALKEIDLAFGEGITAVMGANGSGKTTLLHLAAGILSPAQGGVEVDGVPLSAAGWRLHSELGLLPQTLDFPAHLTPRKLITYLAQLRFLEPEAGFAEMERLGVFHLVDRRFEELSAGEVRMVAVTQALMGAPRFLILDEFSRNLGIEDRQRVLRRILELASGRIILFSTHLCEDVEALAGRVALLAGGRARFAGEPEALIHTARGRVFEVAASERAACLACDTLQVSREVHDETGARLRIVGELPQGMSARSVEPTFEEACLWFFRRYSAAEQDEGRSACKTSP